MENLLASPEPTIVEFSEIVSLVPASFAEPQTTVVYYYVPEQYSECYGVFFLFLVSLFFAFTCRRARDTPLIVQAQPVADVSADGNEKV